MGLILNDEEPVVKLGIEGRPIFVPKDDKIKPNSIKLQLADIERKSERQVYQIMALLGDFGGFNDGVLLLPALLMSLYNSKMFYQAVASFFPVKNRHRGRGTSASQTEERFASKENLGA